MRLSIFLLTFIAWLFFEPITAQTDNTDRGNINIHFGTLAIYNTYSIGYEGFDLIKKSKRHQFRPVVRIGGWNASFINQNNGFLTSVGMSYLFGKKNHFFEHNSALVLHFDKGLKEQPIVFIGNLYRLYFGYRYQPANKRIIARLGVGWTEFIQVGIGYRL